MWVVLRTKRLCDGAGLDATPDYLIQGLAARADMVHFHALLASLSAGDEAGAHELERCVPDLVDFRLAKAFHLAQGLFGSHQDGGYGVIACIFHS